MAWSLLDRYQEEMPRDSFPRVTLHPGAERRERLRRVQERVRSVERAIWAGESNPYLLPALQGIAEEAEWGSEAWRFALRELALRSAESDPWGASLRARQLLSDSPKEHAAWAALGLAQSLLGNCGFAITCYGKALALSPSQPRYAHNLGHLLDVYERAPARALPLLKQAYEADRGCPDTAMSYANTLAQLGRACEGLELVEAALAGARGLRPDQREFLSWLTREARRERNASTPD